MEQDDNIPLLTDLIEEQVDVTIPELGLDAGQNLVIDEDEDPELFLDTDDGSPATGFRSGTRTGKHAELERTVRRILDEHLELAWQEIRLAIEVALEDDDDKPRN